MQKAPTATEEPYRQPANAVELLAQRTVVDGSIAPTMDEAYIRRLRASGVTAANWTVCRPWSEFGDAVAEITQGLQLVDEYPDDLLLVRTVADIEQAHRSGRVGLILGPQNALPAEVGDHGMRVLYELGVRILQLTYNERNAYGYGAGEPDDQGLSPRGKTAIAEMDHLGIVVDLSHCGDRTTLEAIEASSSPMLFTHANSRALHPSPRNKTDEHLRALAANGGVVGVTLWSPMLRFDRRPTIDDFVQHLSYVGDLIGIEHVGIGTDHSEGTSRSHWESTFAAGGMYPTITGPTGPWYGYDTRFAESASSASDLPAVVDAIDKLGLSDSEMTGVLGANFLRVFSQVWK